MGGGAAASPDGLAEARRHFDQAVALFSEGNYNASLAEFEAAYGLYPSAPMLYNIGLSQRALSRYTDAIASLERYLSQSRALTPARHDEVEQLIAEMNALGADVELAVEPAGALVIVDGRSAGTAPVARVKLAPGNHTVDVRADGYRPELRQFLVASGQPLKLTITLRGAAGSGKVRIESLLAIPHVRLDGKDLGAAPVELTVSAGGHTVEAALPGYNPFRGEVVVAADQSRTVTLVLTREKKPAYKQWWPWTILGLGVGGAAAGIVLPLTLTQYEAPLSGTLLPGKGRAP